MEDVAQCTANAMLPHVPKTSPVEAAACVWACGRLRLESHPLVDALPRRLADNEHEALRDLAKFEGQEHLVSGMVWGLARMGWASVVIKTPGKEKDDVACTRKCAFPSSQHRLIMLP